MAAMHYGTPSSLPSDYALLSRYANANKDRSSDNTDDYPDPNSMQDDTHPYGSPITRRISFPSPYLRPLQPKMPELFSPKDSGPDEYTPLLVPRIEEEDSASDDPTCPPSTRIYLDELRILFKYTLPVLGYALQFA